MLTCATSISEPENDEQDSYTDSEAGEDDDMVSEPEDDEQNSDAASESEDEVQEPLTQAELRQRKRMVKQNLEIKWTKVPSSINQPSLRDILFNAAKIVFPFIDPPFQLLFFLVNYNAIARDNFVALKSPSQAFDISRAIFYWRVDPGHGFSVESSHILYNIFLMAFAWGSGFDTKYCQPACKKFVEVSHSHHTTPRSNLQ